ncbi:hypothetical protein CFP56_013375 [Quercus suber]|uniref:Uncharacterized protein n=1 Tax=Quercus suber TaxID=58331 RepID=A0AAW0KTS1_QUESU
MSVFVFFFPPEVLKRVGEISNKRRKLNKDFNEDQTVLNPCNLTDTLVRKRNFSLAPTNPRVGEGGSYGEQADTSCKGDCNGQTNWKKRFASQRLGQPRCLNSSIFSLRLDYLFNDPSQLITPPKATVNKIRLLTDDLKIF